tara:strand:+ start:1666 stop:2277 length:612 start_codon:yes stop_codon:yes gene_type:complete
MKPEIFAIFPEPVYKTKLNRSFTKKEKNYFNKNKTNVQKNLLNSTGLNSFVLDHKEMKNLHSDLINIIKDYFIKVTQTSNSITPCITHSWLNYTKKGQAHHLHNHSNSMVSGIVYINANKNYDSITFWKMGNSIDLAPSTYNLFNSTTWVFPIETYDILLFPSHLYHKVETKQGLNERISLAFNVFVKGKIGSSSTLTELNLL